MKWTEQEMLITLAYYLFQEKVDKRSNLANLMDYSNSLTGKNRTLGAFGRRIGNYKSVDPSKSKIGIVGLTNGGKNIKNIWDNYVTNSENLNVLKDIYIDFLLKNENHKLSTKNKTVDFNNDKLHTSVSEVNVYTRSSKVKELTLNRAGGFCELCLTKAPFIAKNGNPYLEVHHVIHLSRNGRDSTENTLALCPNCHRKLHYGYNFNDSEKKILNAILISELKK